MREPGPQHGRVSVVTMGCARNDVDSEELAGRLAERGWTLTDDDADVVVVNTCGFIDAAKKDSIDALLAAADGGSKVVAVGCLAERYGADLAEQLPEADAVLGFDHYVDISDRLDDVLAGTPLAAHTPVDRRARLPAAPAARQAAASGLSIPGHSTVLGDRQAGRSIPERSAVLDERSSSTLAPTAPVPSAPQIPSYSSIHRVRLTAGPIASLKLASGCDRRCTFCAIPSFRGSFVSRLPEDLLDEARWLVANGVKEIVLVSENSTSYGKDLGDVRLLDAVLPVMAGIEGIERIRLAYLQPAEMRPDLLQVLLETPRLAGYLDLSFQHASERVLRRMRRFGGTTAFLGLIEQSRAMRPDVGIRTNVIVGFPGETEDDLAELERFLTEARMDAVGVFGYSDEEGTEAVHLDGKLDQDAIDDRVARVTALVEELCAQRAEERIGQRVTVLITAVDGGVVEGTAEHQGPETDGVVVLEGCSPAVRVGDLIDATVSDTDGVDLIAAPHIGASLAGA